MNRVIGRRRFEKLLDDLGPRHGLNTFQQAHFPRSGSQGMMERRGLERETDTLFENDPGLTALCASRARKKEVGQHRRIRVAAVDVSLSPERPSQPSILNVVPTRLKEIHPVDDA
jgi:hypothetical protein